MEDDDVPLHKKQAFGAGLHRQRVSFVPASNPSLQTRSSSLPARSAADFYLGLVLPKDAKGRAESDEEKEAECDICKLPISGGGSKKSDGAVVGHEAGIAHQVCLPHSHPPSAIDRRRMGLSVLEAQGWDPDARKGLGHEGQGIRDPVKAAAKNDNLGIGMKEKLRAKTPPAKVEKRQSLNAKQARKRADDDKRKHQALMRQFYGNPDVERYLGSG